MDTRLVESAVALSCPPLPISPWKRIKKMNTSIGAWPGVRRSARVCRGNCTSLQVCSQQRAVGSGGPAGRDAGTADGCSGSRAGSGFWGCGRCFARESPARGEAPRRAVDTWLWSLGLRWAWSHGRGAWSVRTGDSSLWPLLPSHKLVFFVES